MEPPPFAQSPTEESASAPASATHEGTPLEVGLVALKLGLTSFGGPIAHLGYFREEYVVRRRWLEDQTYADLVALSQFLPGPASSQVGIGIGTMRAGWLGGIAAWLGFTMPSAIAMTALAFAVGTFDIAGAGWVHGLKVVAVAIVAQAVWGMGRQFCTERKSATIAVLATLAVLAIPTAFGQVLVILLAGLFGWRLFRDHPLPPPPDHHEVRLSRRFGIACLAIFVVLLIALPLLQIGRPGGAIDLFTRFFRVGSLVFGGGHVVLPLLQTEVVSHGWLTNDQFLAGYGADQAMPGPLFTFAAYLGAIREPSPNGIIGAAVALVAIFLPSLLLIWGAFPFWDALRAKPAFRSALNGINAAVVGILLAALYTPVWTNAILRPADFGLAVVCMGLLFIWKTPPWAVVIVAALGGQLLAQFT